MSEKFYIYKSTICPTCDGATVVANSEWEEVAEQLRSTLKKLLDAEAKNANVAKEAKGIEAKINTLTASTIERQETCPTCSGDGNIEEKIEINKDILQYIKSFIKAEKEKEAATGEVAPKETPEETPKKTK